MSRIRFSSHRMVLGVLALSLPVFSSGEVLPFGSGVDKGEPELSLSLSQVPTGLPGFRMDGVGMNDVSGGRVSGAGDVNGDGIADVIIGARSANTDPLFAGEAYVIFGDPDGGIIDLGNIGTSGFRIMAVFKGKLWDIVYRERETLMGTDWMMSSLVQWSVMLPVVLLSFLARLIIIWWIWNFLEQTRE